MEVTRQTGTTMFIHHDAKRKFQKYIVEKTIEEIQKPIAITYVLLKVTTCLYLSLNNRARSLSTLIADSVSNDTAVNIKPVM